MNLRKVVHTHKLLLDNKKKQATNTHFKIDEPETQWGNESSETLRAT